MKLLKLIPDNTNIRFLRWRVPFYAVSILLMAASMAFFALLIMNMARRSRAAKAAPGRKG